MKFLFQTLYDITKIISVDLLYMSRNFEMVNMDFCDINDKLISFMNRLKIKVYKNSVLSYENEGAI